MKKYKISTFLPSKNKYQGIKITEDAMKQILFLISLHPDNKGIRLGIKKSGCAGFRYTMKLVKNKELEQEGDEQETIFFQEKVLIIIFKKDIFLLDGVKIDFVKNNINKIFKFYNSKLEKFCGCGESFSIN